MRTLGPLQTALKASGMERCHYRCQRPNFSPLTHNWTQRNRRVQQDRPDAPSIANQGCSQGGPQPSTTTEATRSGCRHVLFVWQPPENPQEEEVHTLHRAITQTGGQSAVVGRPPPAVSVTWLNMMDHNVHTHSVCTHGSIAIQRTIPESRWRLY